MTDEQLRAEIDHLRHTIEQALRHLMTLQQDAKGDSEAQVRITQLMREVLDLDSDLADAERWIKGRS